MSLYDALPPPGSESRRYEQPYCRSEADESTLYPPEFNDVYAFNRDPAPWGPGLDEPGESAPDSTGPLLPLNSRRHFPSYRRGHAGPWPPHNGLNMGLPQHQWINHPTPAGGMSMFSTFPAPPPPQPPPFQHRQHYVHGDGEGYHSRPRQFQEPARRRKRSRSTPGGARVSDPHTTRMLSDIKKTVDDLRDEQMEMNIDMQTRAAEEKKEHQRREERDRRFEARLRGVEEAQRRHTMGLSTQIREEVYNVISELQHDHITHPPRQLGPDSAYSSETSISMGLDPSRTRPNARRGDTGLAVGDVQPFSGWVGSDRLPVDGWLSLRNSQERDSYRRPTFR
ncbi:hypothetical protein QBC40DRAFT_324511 [Triangularia verruculosa]|uniref:Uncharacterized protein n=1 Tax=Triangularia verruculosa TaxID=2587418 RepID=A0AAN6XJC1_9PEZI|nr:hypothetical protein QBC40DRAFT_324511 [Triangularia verruculosa]